MRRLTRDGTAEPVSRDQILRHARGQGNVHFPCSADHEQDWQPYPVDPYSAICDDHTYIPSPYWLVQEEVLRRISQYRNPKQRPRVPHVPQASTSATHRILKVLSLCLSLNESQICRTGDTVYIFLYMQAYVKSRPLGTLKGSS